MANGWVSTVLQDFWFCTPWPQSIINPARPTVSPSIWRTTNFASLTTASSLTSSHRQASTLPIKPRCSLCNSNKRWPWDFSTRKKWSARSEKMQSGKLLLTPLANKKETVQNKSADASTRSSNELDTRCRLRMPPKKCRWLTVTRSRHKKSLPR